MDLTRVKGVVKVWEKSFKIVNGREPTKDDIKKDPSGIAEQYALYRKLSKSTTSSTFKSSSSQPPSSTSTQPISNRTTPRLVPNSDYPTTPTPPSRRSSTHVTLPTRKEPVLNAESSGSGSQETGLKRTASKAALNPPSSPIASSSRQLFTTPQKRKSANPYTGPLVDPNPFITTRTSSRHTQANGSSTGQFESPFIHASSPRKLIEVLQANSLRKVKARVDNTEKNNEITPRTRARKRLRGEQVEDTPMKDKLPRRKRGSGLVGSDDARLMKGKEKISGRLNGLEEDGDEEGEEDEFGPSPMKAGSFIGRSFTELIQEVGQSQGESKDNEGLSSITKEKKSRDTSMFGRNNRSSESVQPIPIPKDKPNGNSRTSSGITTSSKSTARPVQQPIPSPEPISDPLVLPTYTLPAETLLSSSPTNNDRLPTPPPDPELERLASQPTPSRIPRPEKVLALSDEEIEEDEWDPESTRGGVKRQLFITGTRRAIIRRRSSFSGSEAEAEEQDEVAVQVDEYSRGGEHEDGTSTTTPASTSIDTPLLSLLSLHSPTVKTRTAKLGELRVKAIFNPVDAARLKAIKRGQDVEQVEDGEVFEGDVGEEGEGREGDDDWEEECDGWKTTGLGMDDDDEPW